LSNSDSKLTGNLKKKLPQVQAALKRLIKHYTCDQSALALPRVERLQGKGSMIKCQAFPLQTKLELTWPLKVGKGLAT